MADLDNGARLSAAERSQRSVLERELKRLDDIAFVREHVVPLLPDGVLVESTPYSYSRTSLTLSIPEREGRAWPGPHGTAGLVAAVRKALGVVKFRRTTAGYDAESAFTQFNGQGSVAGQEVYVAVSLPSQFPTHCRLVVEEKEVTQVVRTLKSVCGPSAA